MIAYFLFLLIQCRCAVLVDSTTETVLRNERDSDLDRILFPTLKDYEVEATLATESKYPWIARLVHSKDNSIPHAGTAVCISNRIFITAARSIYGLKVHITTVIYRQNNLHATAFILPTNGTKQAYDDIGFIVVDSESYNGIWETINLLDVNRTDDTFKWFDNLYISTQSQHLKVVGYATRKGFDTLQLATQQFELCELDVTVGLDLCSSILTQGMIKGFDVPCYHSCSLEEFKNKHIKCERYLGVEGGTVIDKNTSKLVGIATWGSSFPKYSLPVGFSVPNSNEFYKTYKCAMHIRDSTTQVPHKILCEDT